MAVLPPSVQSSLPAFLRPHAIHHTAAQDIPVKGFEVTAPKQNGSRNKLSRNGTETPQTATSTDSEEDEDETADATATNGTEGKKKKRGPGKASAMRRRKMGMKR